MKAPMPMMLAWALLWLPLPSLHASPDSAGQAAIEAWHTFTADTEEERLFTASVHAFEADNPDVAVNIVRIPYLQLLQQFATAAQGHEAPDLVRINSRDLGKLGELRVNGVPVLEDLRPHITPVQRGALDARAVNAMRYDAALYGLPVSQSCLSLIYNKAIFDREGLPYPHDDWNLHEMLAMAKRLTVDSQRGLSMPVKVYYWWVAFQTGFGGWLFDAEGQPTLDSAGSAEALRWMLDLELKHGVVAPGIGIDVEAAKTQFQQGKAAMTIDGPWNWKAFEAAGLELGQALLPWVPETGRRMSPLLAYIGWAVTKQSQRKEAAVRLALWLASPEVQRGFALEAYALPTNVALRRDPLLASDMHLTGFMRQADLATPAPSTRAMALAFEPLNIAIEMAYSGKMQPQAALAAASRSLAAGMRK